MSAATRQSAICSRSAALHWAAAALAAAGIEHPRREARLLLAHALGIAFEELVRDPDAELDLRQYEGLVWRRADGEPLARIVGRRGFWSLDLAVSRATLIPRPETETLVEAALEALPRRADVGTVLDLGTGTGCLLLAGLTEFRQAFGVGVDLAPEAAAIAAANARSCGLDRRAAFLAGNWANPIDARFDLVFSNPPYVPSSEIERLAPEVAIHDPLLALDGDVDGLTAYRHIVPRLPAVLAQHGVAILELGIGQLDAVAALARQVGLASVAVPDLAGIPRALVLRGALP